MAEKKYSFKCLQVKYKTLSKPKPLHLSVIIWDSFSLQCSHCTSSSPLKIKFFLNLNYFGLFSSTISLTIKDWCTSGKTFFSQILHEILFHTVSTRIISSCEIIVSFSSMNSVGYYQQKAWIYNVQFHSTFIRDSSQNKTKWSSLLYFYFKIGRCQVINVSSTSIIIMQ